MENFTSAEDLNKRTLNAQEKIKMRGSGAIEAHFELNKLAEESENVRGEAEKENAVFDQKNKEITRETIVNKKEKHLTADEIIKEFPLSTPGDRSFHYDDLIDLKSNPSENKKEILDVLEKSLKNSNLVDLGAGGDGIRDMIRFASIFGAKKYTAIDIAQYDERFKELMINEFAPTEGIEAEIIEDNYLNALINMPKDNYNFIFFNPPYYNIDDELSKPESIKAEYWKMFYKRIGELTPQGHVFLVDSSYHDNEKGVSLLIESNGFKYIGKIKDDQYDRVGIFVKK